ncbi:AAA family ATPase [Paracrocinitomix mangrovi]|uniref:ATP-binding protein n=1 Tax=Paracrocinitomix mangrovi TaxID=2862509 RepID=UPI001C8DEBA5|nr:AAA family ATPase [Paracrocinitomix mangrovi]UKN02043.1 AAA family ATPase [Paracrocinitomix mangrovi]
MNTPNNIGTEYGSGFTFPRNSFGKKDLVQYISSKIRSKNPDDICLFHVEGGSGVGKTFLIEAICEELVEFTYLKGDYQINGPSDPYQGIAQLFNSPLRHFTAESNEASIKWMQELKHEFTQDAAYLQVVFPLLKNIFSKDQLDQDLTDKSPQLVQNKVNTVLTRFVKFFIDRSESKLILHIDNIEQADSSSIAFLTYLLRQKVPGLILFLTNGTDNINHPVELSNLISTGVKFADYSHVKLENLTKIQLNDFLDAINVEFENGSNSVESFYNATDGNFRAIKEVLERLYLDKELVYKNDKWQVLSKVQFTQSQDQILAKLLEYKVQTLDEEELKILTLSVCFYPHINVPFIHKITLHHEDDIHDIFQKSVKLGIMIPLGAMDQSKDDALRFTNYDFKDAYVQEYLATLISKNVRAEIHKKIADYYLSGSLLGLQDRDVYQAAYHLNLAIDKGASKDEKRITIELNIKAAKRARMSASFQAALEYAKNALKYLEDFNWKADYELLHELISESCPLAKINNQSKLSTSLYDIAKKELKKEHLIRLELVKLILDIKDGELKKALERGVENIRKSGIRVPKNVNKLDVGLAFVRTKMVLGNKTEEQILSLPELKNEEVKLAFKYFFWVFRTAQYLNPMLNGYLALKKLRLTLKHGINGDSFSGLMAYGVIVGAGTDDYKSAYKYCELGDKIAQKFGNESGEVEFGRAIYKAFKYPLKDTIPYYESARSKSHAAGDFIASAETTINESLTYFSAGYSLHDVLAKVEQNLTYCELLDTTDFIEFQIVFKYQVKELMQLEQDYQEREIKAIINHSQNTMIKGMYGIMEMVKYTFNKNWKKTLQVAQEYESSIQNLTGLYFQTEFTFLRGLAAAMMLKENQNDFKTSDLNKWLKTSIQKITKWSDAVADNHLHRLSILNGVNELSNGDYATLEKGAELAQNGGFNHYAGLSYDILSDYKNQDDYIDHYKKWGMQV